MHFTLHVYKCGAHNISQECGSSSMIHIIERINFHFPFGRENMLEPPVLSHFAVYPHNFQILPERLPRLIYPSNGGLIFYLGQFSELSAILLPSLQRI